MISPHNLMQRDSHSCTRCTFHVEKYSLTISDEQVSQPDMQVGCLFGLKKLLCIFKMKAKLERKPMQTL